MIIKLVEIEHSFVQRPFYSSCLRWLELRTYMDWMLAMGDTGLSSDFCLPPDAEIQSESQMRVIDILSM